MILFTAFRNKNKNTCLLSFAPQRLDKHDDSETQHDFTHDDSAPTDLIVQQPPTVWATHQKSRTTRDDRALFGISQSAKPEKDFASIAAD